MSNLTYNQKFWYNYDVESTLELLRDQPRAWTTGERSDLT